MGGGLVRGLAHVGVACALEVAGIPIDYIAGTSAGSIVAALYSAGLNAVNLRERSLDLHWWRISRPAWSRHGLLSFDHLSRWLIRVIGDLQFSELKTSCVVVATDMKKGIPVYLTQGRVAKAVQASCSVPGFVVPVEMDGRTLGDGSLTDVLPVSVLRQMGADYVIGVDIFPFKLRQNLGPIGYMLASLEILLERAGGGIVQADCLIEPSLGGKTYLNFSRRAEFIELGRQAANDKLWKIREEINLAD